MQRADEEINAQGAKCVKIRGRSYVSVHWLVGRRRLLRGTVRRLAICVNRHPHTFVVGISERTKNSIGVSEPLRA